MQNEQNKHATGPDTSPEDVALKPISEIYTAPETPSSGKDVTPVEIPFPKKKRRIGRKILLVLLGALTLYAVYTLAYVYISPDRKIQQIYLVPRDAALIIQSSEPVADWQKFSSSEPWRCLTRSKMFAEIAQRADYLDSLLNDNKTLLSLVGRRDLIISVHKTTADDWDFLMIIDLQKASKLDALKGQLENILKLTGSEVATRAHRGVNITGMIDPVSPDILYMAFVDNHVVLSYTLRLVQAAIDQRDSPGIGLDDSYLRADKLVAGKGLCRVFVNYVNLPELVTLWLSDTALIGELSKSMDFAGLWMDVSNEKMEVNGFTLMREDASPYVEALFGSGKQKTEAHKVIPARTAAYLNVSIDDPAAFIKRLETILSRRDPSFHESYLSMRRLVERYFDVSIDDNLIGWMAGEFAFAQSEPGLLGREPEKVLAIRAKNMKHARENMDLLKRKMGHRSPVRFRSVEYKGYQINYIEIKGIFRGLLGGMAKDFDAVYYSFVGDFVVFSDKSASLLSLIEDYEQKRVLDAVEDFRRSIKRVSGGSTVLAWVDMPKFFPQLQRVLNGATWSDLQTDREVFYSFPRWTFSLAGGGRESSVQAVMEYEVYAPEPLDTVEVQDDDSAQTERELMNELKRFHVEKFEGNVLRDFYPDGALKSESETKRGKRNGRYREYYESGALMVRGRYVDNAPRGTWKYYTADGKFDRKERFR